MNTRTILRQFLTASFVLPTFPKMPENGLNTEASATLVSQVGNAWEKIKQEEKQPFLQSNAVMTAL